MNGEYPEFSRDAVMAAAAAGHADIRAERAYYYTTVQGDERKFQKARLAIRKLGFDSNVFKKQKGMASKGVDISLATDVVSLAYRGEYRSRTWSPVTATMSRSLKRRSAASICRSGKRQWLLSACEFEFAFRGCGAPLTFALELRCPLPGIADCHCERSNTG
jgi:hypothetical protein